MIIEEEEEMKKEGFHNSNNNNNIGRRGDRETRLNQNINNP